MRNGRLWPRISPCAKRSRRSGTTRCVQCSTLCATSCAPAVSGVTCPTICLPGRWFISKAALDSGPLFRDHGGGFADAVAGVLGAQRQPTAMILDSRTLQSTPESGARAGYDEAKRRKGSNVHAAVDTLGHLLALHVTPADEQTHPGRRTDPPSARDPGGNLRIGLRGSRLHRARRRKKRLPGTASNWKWSNILKPNAALSCCHAAGWWREASLGRRVFITSPETTRDLPPRSEPFTSSPSPVL